MARGIIIKGVQRTINQTRQAFTKKRLIVKGRCNRVQADLLRKARDNAPVDEGTHRASMSGEVTDLGYGNGFIIEVSGGDTPYSLWLHEGRYRAHPPHGTSEFIRIGKGGKRTSVHGAVAMSISKLTGGYYYDSKGNMVGRKFLTRALDANKQRYIKNLEKPL